MPAPVETYWPHAPLHRLEESGTYMVTAATYQKVLHFRGRKRLGLLERGLLKFALEYGWTLQAWAVFPNHYHFVGYSPERAKSLSSFLGRLHEQTAKWVNRVEGAAGRKIWHNFRETQLTYERSYLARLNYVHHNAVRHGIVDSASRYPWCSANWFERNATPAQVKTIYSLPWDRVSVRDDFEVALADCECE